MSVPAIASDPLKELTEHLASQVKLPERQGDFDMDDKPEEKVLLHFTDLKTALDWLESNLEEHWRVSDREALNCQKQHRRLARIAIATGTSAIVFAVMQLSVKLTWPDLTAIALGLEAIAIAASVIAVVVGLRAKFDHGWLGQRHLAERLRMIKFRALEQFLCLDQRKWQSWVEGQLHLLKDAEDYTKIGKWVTEDLVEPPLAEPPTCEAAPDLLRALSIYYCSKRVEFQAGYFDRRRKDFEKETGRWPHLSLPLFLISVACVIAHFVLEFFAARAHGEVWSKLLEPLAVWFVALAAIFPVLGLGIRAWFAAFELPRSANLFAAKHRALRTLIDNLKKDADDVWLTLSHLAQAEYFLEQEHREWLRLHLHTEWFL